MAVFLNAGILARPADFVTREIPRISEGFFLVERADQTEEISCLTAYWMSWALVFTYSCSIIRDLWYSTVLGVTDRCIAADAVREDRHGRIPRSPRC